MSEVVTSNLHYDLENKTLSFRQIKKIIIYLGLQNGKN